MGFGPHPLLVSHRILMKSYESNRLHVKLKVLVDMQVSISGG